jgi:hypothetical protein
MGDIKSDEGVEEGGGEITQISKLPDSLQSYGMPEG